MTTMDTTMELSFWKEEPLSPVYSGLEGEQADVWQLVEDDYGTKHAETPTSWDHQEKSGKWVPDSPDDSCDSLIFSHTSPDCATRAQLASQILQDLDEVLVKDEPFAEWYETKTDLPMFDDLPSPTKEGLPTMAYPTFTPAAPAAVHVPLSVVQPVDSLEPLQLIHSIAAADTQTLLQEFESVFGEVEMSHGTLTPPQSPPPALQQLLAAPDDIMPANSALLSAEVDEMVRSHWTPSPYEAAGPPTPDTDDTEWTSPGPSREQQASDTDDAEWTSPGPSREQQVSDTDDAEWTSPGPSKEQQASDTEDPEWTPAGRSGGPPTPDTDGDDWPTAPRAKKRAQTKRGAPYTLEDRKLRKKEQNKNAATRYRMKKKAEVEVILGEENGLLEKNEQLKGRVADLSQEIRYLKNLMRDVFRAKGIIK